MRRSLARAAVAASAALTLAAAPLFVAHAADVEPTNGSGNPDCADLLPAGAYASEHKIEAGDVENDAVVGPVTLKDVKSDENESVSFDFVSEKPIVMVIVKGGKNSAYNVYDYRTETPPYVYADPDGDPAENEGDLTTAFDQGISHITFCTLHDPLGVTVEAEGEYTTTTTWGLEKTVDGEDETTREGVAGQAAGEPVDWDVDLTREDSDGGYDMSGTAVVDNPNPHEVTGTVSATYDGAALPISCDDGKGGDETGFTLDVGEDLTCTFASTEDGTTVEVNVDGTSPGTPDSSDSADVVWTQLFSGAQDVDVDDTRDVEGSPQDEEGVDTATSWNYQEQLTCPADDGETYDESGQYEETVVNTATAVGDGVDLSDTASVVLTCTLPGEEPETGLEVVKTGEGEDDVVNPGETVTYELTVTATGDVTEENVVVSDYVPGRNPDVASGATTYVADSCAPTPCSYDDATGVVTWEVGDLTSGASETVSFAVTVDEPAEGAAVDDIVNIGAAESDQTDPTPSNEVVIPVTGVQPSVTTTTPPAVTPRTLPFADPEPAAQTPRVLPFTGSTLLPVLALGFGASLIGALLIGAGRRRTQE